ncbi:hypothetical protein MNBD_NITROSPINAE02-225 [hydrothermal vent metagenome]|uniref:Flagellar hook-length control protein-like C-terminal domain-containing protein n=1 Tax=hydrothermal vent metagenome TaxID=652676 RepID=A0A3B1CJ98_9ZZZZ
MLEPLTIGNLGKQNFLDKLDKGVQGQPIVDKTFNDVFSSLQETDRKSKEEYDAYGKAKEDENQDAYANDDFDNIDEYDSDSDYDPDYYSDDNPDDRERPMETPLESDDVQQDEEASVDEPVVAEVDKPREDTDIPDDKEPEKVNDKFADKAIGDPPRPNERVALVKAANEAIMKLSELLKEDPLALRKLFAETTDKTVGSILKSLGVSDDSLKELSRIVNLDQKLSEKAMDALKSGKPAAVFNLLKSAGLDKSTLDLASAAMQRKLEGMKPATQTEVTASEAEKETDEDEPDESPRENRRTADKTIKNAKKAGPSPFQVTQQAKAANPNSAVKTTQDAINKADMNAGKAGPKNVATPQAVKGPANNVDFNITNNGPQKAEAAQASHRTQATNKSPGFEKMLMDQIIEKVRINIRQNGRSNMTIRLDPPNLGKVDVRVITQSNMVQALMVVENREVKAVAEANLDSLKAALSNSGFKVDEVVVATANEGYQFKNQNLARDAGFGFNNGRGQGASGGDLAFGGENETETETDRKVAHDGVLDVIA